MKKCEWHKNNEVPNDGDEVVLLAFHSDSKLIGYYDKESNSVVNRNLIWNWEDVERWIKLPAVKETTKSH